MPSGVPVRLSAALTMRARAAAQVLDRSLTEQVEHWARLGQAIESAMTSSTVQKVKARSYDPDLATRLAVADTAAGTAKAAALIRQRNPLRHGITPGGKLVAVGRRSKRAKSTTPR